MAKTQQPTIFILFPYLRTSASVHINGLTFRSTNDVENLDEEERKRLTVLTSLFFLHDHSQIKEMTYTYVDADGLTENAWYSEKLKVGQAFLGLLYLHPSYNSQPFYRVEHLNAFEFTPSVVSKFSFQDNLVINDLWPEQHSPQFDSMSRTSGFNARLNSSATFPILAGGRVYPPAPNMWLNYNQDLYTDLSLYTSQPANWAIHRFFNDPNTGSGDFSKRVLNSLDWHNQSASINIDEGVALLDLAIALESLLNLENGEKVTDRFRETLRTLIGPVPRLDWWCDQFYQARSKIVHQGEWPHLKFYTGPKDQLGKDYKGAEKTATHRSLIAYGRVIFRLTFNAIVTGTTLAQDFKLSSSFVPNNERLVNIFKTLNDESVPPNQRLKIVAQDVMDLDTFFFGAEDAVEPKVLVSVIKSLVRTYLATNPEVSEEILDALRAVTGQGITSLKFDTELDAVRWLAQCVNNWTGGVAMIDHRNEQSRLYGLQQNPINVLDLMLQYIHIL